MLKLRPYRPGDAPVIASWIDSETTFYRWSAGRYGAYPLAVETLEAAYTASCPDGPFPMVMTAEEAPVGHLILRYPDPSDRSTVRLGFVLLDPARRGHGDGKAMLTLALAYAFDQLHAQTVTIGVFDDNLPALHCYQRVGFRVLEGVTEPYAIGQETWTCLELELPRSEWQGETTI